ncbi:MAG: hypothetical protein HWE18_01850 [Gammaproteobacteria bacterium]|nr:hypothetical protein [Gammaproteobacteria bacterium]
MVRLLILLGVIALTACSNQAIYDNVKRNQCLEKTGKIECDDIEDYDEYEKKRQELLKNS